MSWVGSTSGRGFTSKKRAAEELEGEAVGVALRLGQRTKRKALSQTKFLALLRAANHGSGHRP
jgi:hypothetical protein